MRCSRSMPVEVGLRLAVLAVGMALLFWPRGSQADGFVQFTSVTPSTLPAGSDYAADSRGFFWDFSDVQHYYAELTRDSFVGGGSLSDGTFVGTTSTSDPRIWLQPATIPNTIPTPNEGGYFPIDTSRYRYVTFRMYSDASDMAVVYYHRDASFGAGTCGVAGRGGLYIRTQAGWHTYSVDLVGDRLLDSYCSLAWTSGPMQGLALKPATTAGRAIKLDYVRLSGDAPGIDSVGTRTITARWAPTSGSSLSGSTLDLYFDTSPTGASATLIAAGLDAASGRYAWVPPNLAPGTYYLIARQGAQQSVSPPFVVNSPPRLTLLAPSYTSGPDYGSRVAGNPWDMGDPADIRIRAASNLGSYQYSGGVFSAIGLAGDPELELNTPAPVDPARFYYVTYRMRLHAQMGLSGGAGAVARVLWWTGASIPETASTTKDILVYEGWRTVSFDLRRALLEPTSRSTWSDGQKVGFRLDPHEYSAPTAFDVAYVRLTGNDRATGGRFAIRYDASDPDGGQAALRFYYARDRTGAGKTAIACEAPRSGPGPYRALLPVVTTAPDLVPVGRDGDFDPIAGSSCIWNTTAVPDGDYFVLAEATDGTDTALVVSETPVEVRAGGLP